MAFPQLASASAATSSKDYCSLSRGQLLSEFERSESRLAYGNPPGKLGIGQCWWHSLLQRSAVYLTVFRPELPKPSHKAAKKLLKKIASNKSVVEIPGYSNLNEFTADYWEEVEDVLDSWQIMDGFFRQKWLVDLSGKGEISADSMARKLDDLFRVLSEDQFVPYVKIKIQGYKLESHALLITGMTRTTDGYLIQAIDSNFQGATTTLHYRRGDTKIHDDNENWDFAPYLGRQVDFKRIKSSMSTYCKKLGGSAFVNERSGDAGISDDRDLSAE